MPKTTALGRSLLVTGFVAVGVAAAWCMLASWFIGVVESALQSREPYENVYITVDGTPVLVRTSSSGQTTEKILTLAGEPMSLTSQDLLHLPMMAAAAVRPRFIRQLDWQTRLSAANDGGVPPTYWYMVHDGQSPGHAYGVGFHAPTKTITGYFGRRGFSDSRPPRDDWFDIAGYTGMSGMTTAHFGGQEPRYSGQNPRFLLLADGKLWKVDLAQKQLKALLDCPQAYGVGNVWRILEKQPAPAADSERQPASRITPAHALVREPESVLVVNPTSGEHTRYPLTAELRGQMMAGAVLPDGNLAVVAQRRWNDGDMQIVWLKPSGEIAKQQAVRRKTQDNAISIAKLGWQAATAAPLPLANAGFTSIWAPRTVIEGEEANEYGPALGIALARTWPSILVIVAIGCAMAVLAYRRQRRFGLPHPGVWAVFAFLFGIPGWIAYRFHRSWPAMEDCPACRQPAPRDRSHCLDCGAAFPPPPLKGIEVFAP